MDYNRDSEVEQVTLPAISTVEVQQLALFQSVGQQALVQAFAPARTALAQANRLSGPLPAVAAVQHMKDQPTHIDSRLAWHGKTYPPAAAASINQ